MSDQCSDKWSDQCADELEVIKQRVLNQGRQVGGCGVKRLDLIPDIERSQVIFRLELASAEDSAAFMSYFGGIEVGEAVYFKRPLPAGLAAGNGLASGHAEFLKNERSGSPSAPMQPAAA